MNTEPGNSGRLDRILGPAEPEFGCDECFDLLDRYVEAEIDGRSFASCAHCLAPAGCAGSQRCVGMRAHLAGCPACMEEYRSLVALVQSSER